MRVLVACEFSGTVRDAFSAAGHDAWSCDLLPSDTPGQHLQCDVLDILDGFMPVMFTSECDSCGDGTCEKTGQLVDECRCIGPTQDDCEYTVRNGILMGRSTENKNWDLIIAHPPCTYLCSSGLHWNSRVEGRQHKTEESLEFVRKIMDAPCPRICVENPVGCIGTRIRPFDQAIQPYQFGHDASKKTCLWLKGLPPLSHTEFIPPRVVNGKSRWSNQTDSGQNRLGPSADRWALRSITYPGIAAAMATQWGNL